MDNQGQQSRDTNVGLGNTESILKELEFIQAVITRMARNSFLIKAWTLGLVVGALLLKGKWYHGLIAFIPLLIFWYLDAFFLHQERMYRALYNWVVAKRQAGSFEKQFDLNSWRFSKDVASIWSVMVSKTLLAFYGGIALLTAVYLVLLIVIPTTRPA